MMNAYQPNANPSGLQHPPRPALRQHHTIPQGQMQNTLTAPATDLCQPTSMKCANMASNPTYIHSLQLRPPLTGGMITSQSQQNPPTKAPSPTDYNPAIQKRLMGHIRQRMEERIPEYGFHHKPYIFSEDDFRMKMTAYLALNDRETPAGSLDDFPADPETQRRLAQEIVEAMLNREKHSLMDPEARIPLARINKLSPFEIDLMAWNVLFETRDAHRGKISLPSWGKDWPREEFKSFSERLEAVKKTLYHCKAMVSSLFDEVFAKRLPLNPTAEFSRKNSNKRLNGKRKRDLEIAKGAKQDGFVPSYLRKTSESESALSTSCRSPSRQPLLSQQTSSGTPELKRRCTNEREIEAGQELFDVTQNPASFADILQQPQFDQILITDSFKAFTGQDEVQNEVPSLKNESYFIKKPTLDMSSILGSPFGFQPQQGQPEHLANRNAAQQCLSASDPNEWLDNTIAMESDLDQDQKTFDSAQYKLSCNQQWTGHVETPNETDVGNTGPFPGEQAMDEGSYNLISNEELEELLNMPGFFNPEL